ncbi:hydroxymethylbilane synthase [Haloplanus vescus]|uniref:Hydroxymethylbilane synthase n=1 Tax=Haloplanus vescus TaxID=555874 RepID=A0A1H3Z0P4_9EURY|nr:hydroxymethylbilane synthase [Haloplanus vescus]SEA17315.1 hydroxymethylbilane synthase [Haloplanus vescus]
MNTRGTIRLATRGSDLALRQTASVSDRLSARRLDVDVVEVSTRGDEIRDELIHQLGKTGAFVRALDEQVLDGDVDAAVHSMKDMPTESPPELVVAGVPERAPAGDVLVTPDGSELDGLPEGAVVGTSSLRRGAQLRRERPDLQVEPLRGNVDTRVEKLLGPELQREHQRRLDAEDEDEGEHPDAFDQSVEDWFDGLTELERRAMERDPDVEYDAIVLAESGLQRSGLLDTVPTTRLPTESFVPAPGQGAIAVTARADGDAMETIRELVDDPVTRVATTVERTVLAELGGGCIAPIGVHALVQGEYVQVAVQVLSLDGTEVIERTADLPITDHADAAADLAADLREAGAADLIDQAREEAEE